MIYFRQRGTKLWHWSKQCPKRPELELEYTGLAREPDRCLDCKQADESHIAETNTLPK